MNTNNHLQLIIMKYLKIQARNNGNQTCRNSNFFLIAFQDKKQTWSLFFSDQNETTMRVIGLAMHQV